MGRDPAFPLMQIRGKIIYRQNGTDRPYADRDTVSLFGKARFSSHDPNGMASHLSRGTRVTSKREGLFP